MGGLAVRQKTKKKKEGKLRHNNKNFSRKKKKNTCDPLRESRSIRSGVLHVMAGLGGQLPGSQFLYNGPAEGLGGQLPGCDHGVKS